jgi:hypothetical protein
MAQQRAENQYTKHFGGNFEKAASVCLTFIYLFFTAA